MSCAPAPACKALLAQATARWPGRSRASDGICPSPTHSSQNPTSDHELGNAVDLTHDPAHGCDAHAWARDLVERRDRRVTYIISNKRIVSSLPVGGYAAWTWRNYTGANPHQSHVHVSIKSASRGDCSPWFVVPAPPLPTPTPPPEDDMPKPTDFTSACIDPTTGGHWQQTAEGGVEGHNGAAPVRRSYKDYVAQLGPRTFLAIVPNGAGGFIQIASDGSRYNSKDWT